MGCVWTYRFEFAGRGARELDISLDAQGRIVLPVGRAVPPQWARLEHGICPHCPLDPRLHDYCPLAVTIVPLVNLCSDVCSHDEVDVRASCELRTISARRTTAQRAVSSAMGLLMGASDCPRTRFLAPMARFHLPLADDVETVYRAASMWMLAQYFRSREGKNPDMDLAELREHYADLHLVNQAVAGRFRSAPSGEDAQMNALVLLDLLAKSVPYSIEESLEELAALFAEGGS